MNYNFKVSFDFDGTLTKKDVQDYASSLVRKGVNVFIVTARYNELQKHKWEINPSNEIVLEVANKIGVPLQNIVFTNMKNKSEYLNGSNAVFHLDDDIYTIEEINANSDVICVDVTKKDWKKQCDKLLGI